MDMNTTLMEQCFSVSVGCGGRQLFATTTLKVCNVGGANSILKSTSLQEHDPC